MSEEQEDITIGMGRYEARKPGSILLCVGIGSCVATILLDEKNDVYGMAHVMLPYHKDSFKTANPNKYADVCIPNLIKEMENLGASKANLKAKIAGGAHMFPTLPPNPNSINVKNVEAVKDVLKKEGIRIIAEDTGGNNGRTVSINTVTKECSVLIRSKGERRTI